MMQELIALIASFEESGDSEIVEILRSEEFIQYLEDLAVESYHFNQDITAKTYFLQGSYSMKKIDLCYELYHYAKDMEKIPVFRSLEAASLKSVDYPGDFWAFDPAGTSVYNKVRSDAILIEAVGMLNVSQINWAKTFALLLRDSDEYEVSFEGKVQTYQIYESFDEEIVQKVQQFLIANGIEEVDAEDIAKIYRREYFDE